MHCPERTCPPYQEVVYCPFMTKEAIQTQLDVSHFVPLNLITSSGKTYHVPHPDFVTFSPTGRTCNVYAANGEYFTMLDVESITEVAQVKRRFPGKRKR